MVLTTEEVAEILNMSVDQVYKLNGHNRFPIYKLGKQNRYLYSEVMNWFKNQDTRIKDDPDLHEKRPLDELPKCWPEAENLKPGEDLPETRWSAPKPPRPTV